MKSTIKRQHSAVIVQIPYNQFLIQEIKKLGGKWIAEEKAWELPLEAYDEAAKLIDKKHYGDYIDQRERIKNLKRRFY